MPDIAIVGAGPSGLYTAARCAAAGLDVLVLEEHRAVGQPTHCTGIVSLETTEFAKIPDEIVLNRLRHARLHAPGGAECLVDWRPAHEEQILVIDRAGFDRLLLESAVAEGAVVQTGTSIDRVRIDRDGVELSSDGLTVRARACVLACGVSYALHRQLGLPLPSSVVHTAQLEIDAEMSDAVDLYFGRVNAPDGFLWTVPVTREGRSRLKVGVMARGNAAACLARFLARPELRERITGEPDLPVRRLLPLRPITRTFGDRFVVVGDAGGFTKPTTGGGIFYSLLTAALAADTLIESLRVGRTDAEALGAYQRRWQERLSQELQVADWLRRVVTKCTDAEIDTLVNAASAADVRAILSQTARFNWHRDLILTLLRRQSIASVVIRSLFR